MGLVFNPLWWVQIRQWRNEMRILQGVVILLQKVCKKRYPRIISVACGLCLLLPGLVYAADDGNQALVRQLQTSASQPKTKAVINSTPALTAISSANSAASVSTNTPLSTGTNGANAAKPVQTGAVPNGGMVSGMVGQDPNEAAFDAMAANLLPLTPTQIHRLKNMFAASKKAVAAPAGVPPTPVATSQLVSLSPGSTPPVARLAQGFVSSIVFLDSTGAPWPIAAYDLGNPQAFNIQWNHKDNTLMIQALKMYTYGNLAVRLKGLQTPVMLTLIPGQKMVDYRVDMRVQGVGPLATHLPQGNGLPSTESPTLLGILNGAAPNGATPLQVTDHLAQAWILGDKIYLRTQYPLLSPGWIASLKSADGTTVYKIQKTPLILASVHGKVVQLKLKGF